MVQEAARTAGARLALAGDTEQLGAVEAGGMFRLLAREVPCAELHEVRRFDAAWEAGASVRLRAGDFTAYAAYDRHGRMRGADQEAATDRAGGHVAGRSPARQERPAAGRVQQRGRRAVPPGPGQADPAREGPAAAGRAGGRQPGRYRRLDPGPAQYEDQRGRPGADQPGHAEDHRLARAARPGAPPGPRRQLDQPVPGPPGRTWRTAPSWTTRATPTSGKAGPWTPPTCWSPKRCPAGPCTSGSPGAGSPTPRTSSPGTPRRPAIRPTQQASPESVVKAILDRDDPDLSATEQIRQAQELDRGNRPPAHPVDRRGPAVAVPADRPADQGPAHRIRSLAIRAGTLTSCPPAEAPRRPARRARHQLDHRPDHRRAAGRRSVHFQRPARPPPAASAARPRP